MSARAVLVVEALTRQRGLRDQGRPDPIVMAPTWPDNADEGRLALLQGEEADRLRAKYGRAAEILDGEE